jgi:hypothetical protein
MALRFAESLRKTPGVAVISERCRPVHLLVLRHCQSRWEANSHGNLVVYVGPPWENYYRLRATRDSANSYCPTFASGSSAPHLKNSRRPTRLDNAPRGAIRDSRLRRHANGSAWVKDHISLERIFHCEGFRYRL